MALSIWPIGDGTTRRRVFKIHAVGLFTGATVTALVLTLTGAAAGSVSVPDYIEVVLALAAATIAAVWTGSTLLGRRVALPQSTWQVPDVWRERFPPDFTFLAYGFLLGLGFLVRVVVPAFWLLAGLTIALGNPLVALPAWWLYAGLRISTTRRLVAEMDGCAVPTDVLPGDDRLRWIRFGSAATTLALTAFVVASVFKA